MSDDLYTTITDKVGEGFYSEKRSKFMAFAHHVGRKGAFSGPTTMGNRVAPQENPSWDKSTARD